ncbi:hypothetical protein IX317_002153 [Fusobacterium sp. DD29]|uniref:baseplate J/gp47 family protein n=1 Tax=unclassified Fusobacterium TaxID=2648384 RepID=UPI001B8D0E51|nr:MULTISPECIES: baseplate J/gp47 family protein [unclassified Fusobacterium]MBR8701168.1 hypothetical protein [Fusobacterium sp. DD45]MBR8711319.1 hypothetical protein [Fusobacterium sp. DD28]MBR8750431.1 hypothetical protein [Fusobacterium sp. DD29]MBR8751868.1 hypothetical protein [Fusobacterium sp. DD26]MBR8762667.1 hypothetical protein [Fusobacterium sp. DD25]
MFKFIDVNVTEIQQKLKTGYEEVMNLKVSEGDPINDYINWVSYIIRLLENEINYTANMNLLRFSEGEYLDAIGELVGVRRVQPKGAKTKIKYTFSKIFSEVITIPAGNKTSDGNVYFALDNNIELAIGKREVIGIATCVSPGKIGNDILPGKINTLVDDIPFLMKVENIEATSGGLEMENDNELRKRIKLRPTAFSTAGPKSAYEYYVMTANTDIIDVNVYTEEKTPGTVNIIPLLKSGKIPEQQVLETISKNLDDEIRPFTDKVVVKAPIEETYSINIKWWARKGDNITEVTNNITDAVNTYVLWQSEKLGRDINPDKLIQLLISAGAKRVEIAEPTLKRIDRTKVAKISSKNISYQGVEDE